MCFQKLPQPILLGHRESSRSVVHPLMLEEQQWQSPLYPSGIGYTPIPTTQQQLELKSGLWCSIRYLFHRGQLKLPVSEKLSACAVVRFDRCDQQEREKYIKIYKNRFASVSSTSLKEVVLTGVLSIPQQPQSNQVCDFCEW